MKLSRILRSPGIEVAMNVEFSVRHYLGHTKIAHTYWYLSAVPELMALAGDKFERFVALGGADDE